MISEILKNTTLGKDGIYTSDFKAIEQTNEIKLRDEIAKQHFTDPMDAISKNHSIPVMDHEIKRFVSSIPQGGVIVDIGGGWGWHWRNLKQDRPDVTVIIVDFVISNLEKAKNILSGEIGSSIYLLHADATSLPLESNTIDGYWSVQTLQHISDFSRTIVEAYRILKPHGVFSNYSLNNQYLFHLIYWIFGKKYHVCGDRPSSYYLCRASKEQLAIIEKVFKNKCHRKFSEILFYPDLKLTFSGKENSLVGRIDSLLSSDFSFFSVIARQQSFHISKFE